MILVYKCLLAINEMSTNTRVQVNVLPTPFVLKRQHPLTKDMIRDISTWRQTIVDILHGKDSRLLMIVGPCSVHDPIAVVDYASCLSI